MRVRNLKTGFGILLAVIAALPLNPSAKAEDVQTLFLEAYLQGLKSLADQSAPVSDDWLMKPSRDLTQEMLGLLLDRVNVRMSETIYLPLTLRMDTLEKKLTEGGVTQLSDEEKREIELLASIVRVIDEVLQVPVSVQTRAKEFQRATQKQIPQTLSVGTLDGEAWRRAQKLVFAAVQNNLVDLVATMRKSKKLMSENVIEQAVWAVIYKQFITAEGRTPGEPQAREAFHQANHEIARLGALRIGVSEERVAALLRSLDPKRSAPDPQRN